MEPDPEAPGGADRLSAAATEREAPRLPLAPVQLEARELVARENACARLRRLLADGVWHGMAELVAAGGLRYGGRLHEIRRGEDGGPPLDIVAARAPAPGTGWRYRLAPPQRP